MCDIFPRWLLEFYEFDELIKLQANTTQQSQNSIDYIINNRFIDYIDEETAKKYELFLGITNSENRSLEERKAIIKTYFLGNGKVSMSIILNIIETLSNGKVNGYFKDIDSEYNQGIIIEVYDCILGDMLAEIINILEKRIPAHLNIEVQYTPYGVSLMQYSHIAHNHTVNQSIGTSGVYNDYNSINKNNLLLFQNNSRINSIVAELPLIYGGNFFSYDDDEISGGDFNDYYSTETYDGNYLF